MYLITRPHQASKLTNPEQMHPEVFLQLCCSAYTSFVLIGNDAAIVL